MKRYTTSLVTQGEVPTKTMQETVSYPSLQGKNIKFNKPKCLQLCSQIERLYSSADSLYWYNFREQFATIKLSIDV